MVLAQRKELEEELPPSILLLLEVSILSCLCCSELDPQPLTVHRGGSASPFLESSEDVAASINKEPDEPADVDISVD